MTYLFFDEDGNRRIVNDKNPLPVTSTGTTVLTRHEFTVTPAQASSGAIVENQVPLTGAHGRAVSVRIAAPELTGATTGLQWAAIGHKSTGGDIIETLRVAGTSPEANLEFTPGVHDSPSLQSSAWGDFRTVYSSDVPLYAWYRNTTDAELPSNAVIQLVVEETR